MPVLVTAAHQPLARRLALRLLDEGGEVRVTADGDASLLRAAGAFVATASGDDEARIEASLADVHTVVHVGGGVAEGGPARILADARTIVRASLGAEVRRLLLLSLPGADPGAQEPVRAAKGEVERLASGAELPTVVLRVGLVDTPWLRDALATAGLPTAELERRVRPVQVDDLVELVVAFDRARSSAPSGHLVVRADGPEVCSLGDLSAGSPVGGGRPGRIGRRLPDPGTVERLRAWLAGTWEDRDPALLDGWAFAGLIPSAPR